MRRRTGWWVVLAALALGAGGGCGAEPEGAVLLPTGRYPYRATHPIPDATDSMRLEGFLHITYAAPDSLAGRWEVPRMHPELRAATAADGAVEIRGQPTYFGTIVHRVAADPGGGFRCSGRYSWVSDGGEERSLPVTCSLRPDTTDG